MVMKTFRRVKIFGNMSMSQTLIALGAVDGNWDLSVPANLFFHMNSSCLIRSGDGKSSLYMATTSSNDGNSSVVHKTDEIRFIILAESTASSENCASSSEIIWLRKVEVVN